MLLSLYMLIISLLECSVCMYTVIDTMSSVFGQCSVCQRSCLWSDVDDVADSVDAMLFEWQRMF